jgi:NAD(P)-dependent dehydrogenase (short-subunit alcohol dehydrogenase family)
MEIDNLFGVKGKVVLVTGGGRGIGFMISQGFVRNGATVYIASRSKKVSSRFLFHFIIGKFISHIN